MESIVKLLEENDFVLEDNYQNHVNQYFREEGKHRYVLSRHNHRRGIYKRNEISQTDSSKHDFVTRSLIANSSKRESEEKKDEEDSHNMRGNDGESSKAASRDFNSMNSGQENLILGSVSTASSVSKLQTDNSIKLAREGKSSSQKLIRSGESKKMRDYESETESSASEDVSDSESSTGSQDEIDEMLFRSEFKKKRKYICVIII